MIDVGPAESSKFHGLLLESNHLSINDRVTKSQICSVTINYSTRDTTRCVFLFAKDGREDQKQASRWKSEDVLADLHKFRGRGLGGAGMVVTKVAHMTSNEIRA